MVPSLHPPLDYSVFGLKGWSGARWVEFFQGEVPKPVWSVSLGHSSNEHALILVTTSPRERWGAMAGRQQLGPSEFASDVVRVLIDMARAEFGGPARGQYDRAIWPFAQAQGWAWRSWDQTRWRFDGHVIPARIWRFAHAWTGLTLGVPGHYVAVTSFDSEDLEVDLAEVSGTDYGLDFTVPFGIGQLQRTRHAVIPKVLRSKSQHPDHDRVIAFRSPPES